MVGDGGAAARGGQAVLDRSRLLWFSAIEAQFENWYEPKAN